jgi:hypothetical protein
VSVGVIIFGDNTISVRRTLLRISCLVATIFQSCNCRIIRLVQIKLRIHNRNYRKRLRRCRILQLPQHPPLRQLGQWSVFRYHLLTRDIARKYSAVKHKSISSKAMLEGTELTSSTFTTAPYSAIASAPSSPSAWPMLRLSIPPAHARHSLEIFGCEA